MTNQYQPLETAAQEAASLIKAKSDNWTGIAAQFALEKGWEWWTEPVSPFNVGNNFDTHGHIETFASLDAGVKGYVTALTVDPAGYYTKAVDALRQSTATDFVIAICETPYCYPPYHVSTLMDVYDLVIQRFPGADPHPKPEPKHWVSLVGWFPSVADAVEGEAKIKAACKLASVRVVKVDTVHFSIEIGWFPTQAASQAACTEIKAKTGYNAYKVVQV